jgi:hypothetical protein
VRIRRRVHGEAVGRGRAAAAADLETLGDRFRDDEFTTELYRALANNTWHGRGSSEPVTLSWSRAEELVNELRERAGREPLELVQTGGEGQVSPVVADELRRLGWTSQPLDTSRHDETHVATAESPPPKGTGERFAPVEDSDAWEREAHEEADAEQRRRTMEVPRRPP